MADAVRVKVPQPAGLAPTRPGAVYVHRTVEGRFEVVRLVLDRSGWTLWLQKERKARCRRRDDAFPVSLGQFVEKYVLAGADA